MLGVPRIDEKSQGIHGYTKGLQDFVTQSGRLKSLDAVLQNEAADWTLCGALQLGYEGFMVVLY